MSKFLLFINIFIFLSCSKYQVVQEIKVNMYHLHNPKNKKVEVILTKQQLEIGKWYRLKNIDIIELDER